MSDTTDHRSPGAKARANIARAHTERRAVDNNGQPTGSPVRYIYDGSGRLVSVEPEDDQ
jgi:hypothetical protein